LSGLLFLNPEIQDLDHEHRRVECQSLCPSFKKVISNQQGEKKYVRNYNGEVGYSCIRAAVTEASRERFRTVFL